MEPRKITNDDLTEAVASALGKTPEEIKNSETFEQAIYDLAFTNSLFGLPEINHSGKAQYKIKEDRVIIKYGESRILHHQTDFIKNLAIFYNAYFPETKVAAYQGEIVERDWISFLAAPFIDKVLPAMKLWKEKPSDLILRKDQEAYKRGPEFSKFDPHIGMAYC